MSARHLWQGSGWVFPSTKTVTMFALWLLFLWEKCLRYCGSFCFAVIVTKAVVSKQLIILWPNCLSYLSRTVNTLLPCSTVQECDLHCDIPRSNSRSYKLSLIWLPKDTTPICYWHKWQHGLWNLWILFCNEKQHQICEFSHSASWFRTGHLLLLWK